jgi:2-iminobutanoate/2-iminopropanoate deaminase
MSRQIQTDRAPTPRGCYSQAVQAGAFLFIAGQLPIDLERRVVGYTPGQQMRQALRNMLAIVEAAGGQLSDVVNVTVYVSDMEYWSEVNAAYAEFFAPVAVKPARAVVPVKEMFSGSQVEVQAVAYLDPAKTAA